MDINKWNSKFAAELLEISKLFPYNIYSIIPSVLFLTSVFTLFYIQLHKTDHLSTSWKTRICKHALFHWTYFYTSRIWFLFVRICKWIMQYSDKALEKNSQRDEIYYNKIITHFCVFVFVLSISLIPCLILYVRYLNRREFPNFLMWVAEDPWVRSEIGTSGHYLERPPIADVYSPHKYNASYRSGRSSSVDTNVYLQKQPSYLRPCKSAANIKKSTENIVN